MRALMGKQETATTVSVDNRDGSAVNPAEPIGETARQEGYLLTIRRHTARSILKLIVPAIVIAIWQISVSEWHYGKGFVPTPLNVIKALSVWIFGPPRFANIYSGTWVTAMWASSERVLIGFAVAALLGAPLGILIGRWRIMANLMDPLIQLLRPIPTVAWVPFSIVFFGIGSASAIFLIAFGSFFPIVLNATDGARRVPLLYQRAAHMLGASPSRLLLRVIIPAALAPILVGLRLAMGLAWVLVIVAEIVAVKSGLGYSLWNAYYLGQMDIVVCAMVSVGVLGFISDGVIRVLTHFLLSWQERGA